MTPRFPALLVDPETQSTFFRGQQETFVQMMPSSASAYLAWEFLNTFQRPAIWITNRPQSLERLYLNLCTLSFGREDRLLLYPALETLSGDESGRDLDIQGERFKTLFHFLDPSRPSIVATCVQALMLKTPPPQALQRQCLFLELTTEKALEGFISELEGLGYVFETEVNKKGQVSLRGGIVDIWPLTELWPIRIEFFGATVDSIRTFDPATQLSIQRLSSITIPPTFEGCDNSTDNKEGAHLVDSLPVDTLCIWVDSERIHEQAQAYEKTIRERGPVDRFVSLSTLKDLSNAYKQISMTADLSNPCMDLGLKPCKGLLAMQNNLFQPDFVETERKKFVQKLIKHSQDNEPIHLFFNSEGFRDRFTESYITNKRNARKLHRHVGYLSEGFRSVKTPLMVIAQSDIYSERTWGQKNQIGPRKKKKKGRNPQTALMDWSEIQPGQRVVHIDHGIGKYLGMYEIRFQGQAQEVLAIEYANQAKLYVPVSQVHLLSRYVSVGKSQPALHALGHTRWMREKASAQQAVNDLASNLVETQATRQLRPGHAFAKDTTWQHEFESSFPFQETEDQERVIQEVKQDMEHPSPMDRLICGDVGYGKTEVALRAAFKAVMDQKQVAILVPTTVLAQQHYATFSERLAAFPVRTNMLSRFRTPAEQRTIIAQLKEGQIDIIIGTHRLIQPDVHFKDLGLIIIDEEQRFGVANKEHLKGLRQLADVLTLTATPIPRTLYMSLTGAKNMSTIQTPPKERLPIETIVTPAQDDIIRRAILHERSRGGQVFYLYNRVMTIHKVRQRLETLVPEVRIAVAHGQMKARMLESVMARFAEGTFDVLLCTTLIESGVGIPNVNTILIDRADRFGLSDLYQLRGRVGRYKHKAYAYFLLPEHGPVFDTARKRIQAIQKYSSLGAGFKIALRDLEIRGAGNILGREQSGHIAAVGFDLYCQFLQRSIAMLKGEDPPPIIDVELKLDFIDLSAEQHNEASSATIPFPYIEDETLRLGIYRKMVTAARKKDVETLRKEMRDRFGPLPRSVERLLTLASLRITATSHQIQTIEVYDKKLMIKKENEYLMKNRKFPRLKSERCDDKISEIISMLETWDMLSEKRSL